MITQEMKDKGITCKGYGFNCCICKDKKLCVDYNKKLEHLLPNKENEVPMPKCKQPKQSNIELLKELLNNPRVEGITINIEKVGDIEETNINAKLKESMD